MSNTIAYVNNQTLTNIADAVRYKTGTNEKMLLSDIPDTIRNLDTSDITALDTRVTAVEGALANVNGRLANSTKALSEQISEINSFGNNLFAGDIWEKGGLSSTGDDVSLSTRYRTNYIDISAYTDVSIERDAEGYNYYVCCFDADKTFIPDLSFYGWRTSTLSITMSDYPAVKYLRLQMQRTDNTVADGDYEHIHGTHNTVLQKTIERLEGATSDLKRDLNNNVDVSALGWVLGSLTSGTGTESNATTRIRSDYVAVSEGTKIEVSGNANCLIVYCFNEYKTWISDSGWNDGNVFTVPSGVSYIRILIRKTSRNTDIDSAEVTDQYRRCTITLGISQNLLVYRYTNEDVLNLSESTSFASDILKHGYYQMNYKSFVNKRWYLNMNNGNISAANAPYRVSYPSIITLDYDVEMRVNDTNYAIYGYQYINGAWSYFVGSQTPIIESGVQFVFTIKLVNEDTSITADIETFVSKVEFYTAVSAGIENSTKPAISILTANDDAVNKVWASRWLRSSTAKPLTLLWFSDIHRWVTPLKRVIEFKNYLTGLGILDDSIVTGDLVRNSSDEAAAFNAFWTDTDGTADILIALGNHDHYDVGSQPHGKATFTKIDSLFFQTVSDWHVTRESNYPFYYKDYTSQKIRLIVADPAVTSDEADETTWLTQTLNGAKALGYSVVIACHYIRTASATIYDNNWSNNLARDTETDSMSYDWSGCDIVQCVTDFITNGGKFMCYMIGHTHTDIIGYVTDHPEQLIINVPSASDDRSHETPLTTNDLPRYDNSRTQDCFNVITFDAENSIIKCVRVGANVTMYEQPRTAFSYNCLTHEFINLM